MSAREAETVQPRSKASVTSSKGRSSSSTVPSWLGQRGHHALEQIGAGRRHEGAVQRHPHGTSGAPHLAQADHHGIGTVGPLDRLHTDPRPIDGDHPTLTLTGEQ